VISLASQTKDIGPYAYEVTPLPAGAANRVFMALLRSLAPGFATVREMRDAAGALMAGLASVLSELDDAQYAFVAGEFAKVTRWGEGDKRMPLHSVYDTHFQGRFFDEKKWLRFALEVTFGPLGELPASFAEALGVDLKV
jgi:hypothetical protein